MKLFSFRNVRIVFLLILLAFVGIYTLEQKRHTTSWLQPLQVVIYPINGDGLQSTQRYIDQLDHNSFSVIERFFSRRSEPYEVYSRQPFVIRPGAQKNQRPPAPPEAGSTFSIMLWSLKLRYWAWKNSDDDADGLTRIRVYVIYQKPQKNVVLPHSLGLQKGLIGVIHAFASKKQQAQNNVIIAHEILHTVGASDKYDPQNGMPLYPSGYARPDKKPLYPQYKAEIMAGRLAEDDSHWKMVFSLNSTVVGNKTAREIGWLGKE
ncbi:MAG: hypothetical protein KZQ58_09055 [gamma proteobacterium symbiont of Bathyaustriella thionipta]|nr:hypothetical protein [gamma proteobacterium symbiont of Bathyaustriella thionipta]